MPRWLALKVFVVIFIAILILHAPLLRLPFFWDEAGFYVQAAHDLTTTHSVITRSTMDTGHPPLPAIYQALWLNAAGWNPVASRIASLLLAAFALTNVFLLARRVASPGVAVASTIAAAVYPIFFVQSSLAHADLPAAAFALWGIRLGIEHRLWTSQLAFSLAVLSKETAIIMPLALAAWELFVSPKTERFTALRLRSGQAPDAKDAKEDHKKLLRISADERGSSDTKTETTSGNSEGHRYGRFGRALIRLVPVLPLAAWLLYHYYATGRFFGNAEYYAYNVSSTLDPVRFLLALVLRFWHLLGIMNMLVLTVATLAVMWFSPVKDGEQERQRIAVPIQLQFAFILQAHLLAYSLVGGALLTRYLLAAYPMIIIIGMSTLRRRIQQWPWAAGAIIAFFAVALLTVPPYRIAPEDNLTYKDFVELHVKATRFLEQHEQGATILTAWPATDELTHPYLGYVQKPLPVVSIENFTLEEIYTARQAQGRYQVAYLFSTKYDQPRRLRFQFWERFSTRYFGDHTDLQPEVAEGLLGGKIRFIAREGAEWVAIIEIEDSVRARASNQHSAISTQP